MITVVNQKTIRNTDVTGNYIGRKHPEFTVASPLANPYKIGRDGTREEVIAKYRRWLWKEMRNRAGAAYRELVRLVQLEMTGENVILICWCKPGFCHGDILVEAIAYLKKQLIHSYIQARVAEDQPLVELLVQDLLPESSAALDVIAPAFSLYKEAEITRSNLWSPGKLEPVTLEGELFAPYVGQLFSYAVWEELDDLDSSLSTIYGRAETIESLSEALPVAAVEATHVAFKFRIECAEHLCSGAPIERETISTKPLPWIGSRQTALVA